MFVVDTRSTTNNRGAAEIAAAKSQAAAAESLAIQERERRLIAENDSHLADDKRKQIEQELQELKESHLAQVHKSQHTIQSVSYDRNMGCATLFFFGARPIV